MSEEIEYINRNGLNKIAGETKKLVNAVGAKATKNAEDIAVVDAKIDQLTETVSGFNEAPDMEEITAEEVRAMLTEG